MKKLHATIKNSKGVMLALGDDETITATVYDGNLKAYSVIIDFCNIGDIEQPTYGAIVTTREWRNQTDEKRKAQPHELPTEV